MICKIGEGSYGNVWKAKDIVKNEFVAIKRYKEKLEVFGFPRSAIIEISYLRKLVNPNIVELLGFNFSLN